MVLASQGVGYGEGLGIHREGHVMLLLSVGEGPGCDEAQQQRNLAWYAGFGALAAVMACWQAMVLTPCALRASRGLHARLVSSILAAPMSFFDSTSAGATLNRFLQDMASVDVFVPNATMQLASKTLDICVRLGLVASMAPYSLLIVPLLMPAYNSIYQRVRIAARDTRRIEGVAHSPVYTFFGDMLRGRHIIRAFGVQRQFLAANEKLVHQLSSGTVGNQAVCKWAQALTVQTGAFLYFGCGAVCIYLNSVGRMNTSQLGLVLLYAAELQRAGMEYMMTLTNVETHFVSVERIAAYTRLEDEFEATCKTSLWRHEVGAGSMARRQRVPAMHTGCMPKRGALARTAAMALEQTSGFRMQ